jgi:replicative DNA helicase
LQNILAVKNYTFYKIYIAILYPNKLKWQETMSKHSYDKNIEQSVLSSIIFEPGLLKECQEIGLESKHFFTPFHQNLYDTVLGLYENSVIDESFIKEAMGKLYNEFMMLELLVKSPVSNINLYGLKLKELSQLREAKQLASKIIQSVEEQGDYLETLKVIHEGVEILDSDKTELINIQSFDSITAKEAEFICKGWLPFPKRAVSMVSAGGGIGKSFIMLQAAMRMVKEEDLKVFLWLSEDPVELSKYRFNMIKNSIISDQNDDFYRHKLHIAGADSESIHFLEEDKSGMRVNGKFYQFKKMLSSYDVIILDPLIAMFGGDENNNAQARVFINLFSRWATKEDKTIIFIHHGNKNTGQSRGASAFVDAVRLVYQVDIVKDKEGEQIEDHMRELTITKDNNGAKKYFGGSRAKRKIFPEVKKEALEIVFE